MMAPIASYVAPFGARLAHAMPKRRLEVGVRPVSACCIRALPDQLGGVVGVKPRSLVHAVAQRDGAANPQ